MLGDTAVEPLVGTFHGGFHVVVILGFGEVVESHVNICADSPLGLHARFGSNLEFAAVDVRFEFDAFFGDFDIWQTKNLKTARISESGFVPATKLG